MRSLSVTRIANMVQKCKYERGLGIGTIGHMHPTYRLSEQEQSIKFALWFVTVCLLCSCLLNAGLLIQNSFCFSVWGGYGAAGSREGDGW